MELRKLGFYINNQGNFLAINIKISNKKPKKSTTHVEY